MSQPRPKTNTLYLNGIVVGEVEATGDHEEDMEAARQLLKDKGLYKSTALVWRQVVAAPGGGRPNRNYNRR